MKEEKEKYMVNKFDKNSLSMINASLELTLVNGEELLKQIEKVQRLSTELSHELQKLNNFRPVYHQK